MSDNDAIQPMSNEQWLERLNAERERLVGLRASIIDEHEPHDDREHNGSITTIDSHHADRGAATYELELETSMLHRFDDEIERVDEAMAKLGAGTFGLCERCSEPIRDERLDFEPAARYCITHQAEMTG